MNTLRIARIVDSRKSGIRRYTAARAAASRCLEPSMLDLITTVPMLVAWLAIGASFISRQAAEERNLLWWCLAAHLASAIGMILVTDFYYGGGDMMAYAAIGRFFADRLRADFFGFAPDLLSVVFQQDKPFPVPGAQAGSNTGSMQALSGFVMFLCGDSLYAACVAIGGLNFFAKVAVYRALRQQLTDIPFTTLAIPCLLVPSAVFWSSGLLKESIAVIGLAMMVHGGASLGLMLRPISGFLLLGAGATIVFLIKGYLLPPFGIGVGLWFVARSVQRRGSEVVLHTRHIVFGTVIALSLVVGTGLYLPQFSPETFADEARAAQDIGARMSAGSNYSLGGGSVATQLPLAIITVFFRPALIESGSVMIFLNALEMTWFTVLAAQALFRRTLRQNLTEIITRPPLAFCFGFAITLAIGVGLTTVNLGTLSRYRMPLMPFYAVLLFVLTAQKSGRAALGPTVTGNRALSQAA